jgi:hypothetical protein
MKKPKSKSHLFGFHRRSLYRRFKKQDVPLCYSSNGLLVDLLEDHGFAVLELYSAPEDFRDYFVRIRPHVEDPRLKELLARQLKSRRRLWPF